VNKTIFKPRVAAAAGHANTYTWDFPDVKFHVPALIRYLRKQSSSGIRTIIRIGLKTSQTDKRTRAKTCTYSFVGGK